jgi:tellurite resistance-related uncharacterized protein
MIVSTRKVQATLFVLVAAARCFAGQRSAFGFGIGGRTLQTRALFPQRTRESIIFSVPSLGAENESSVAYKADGMPILPEGLVKYSQAPKTGAFTAQSVPIGLLKNHSTKAGTWGVIRVSKGSLEYKIHEPRESVHVLVLESASVSTTATNTNNVGIIEPNRLHQVSPLSDDVRGLLVKVVKMLFLCNCDPYIIPYSNLYSPISLTTLRTAS